MSWRSKGAVKNVPYPTKCLSMISILVVLVMLIPTSYQFFNGSNLEAAADMISTTRGKPEDYYDIKQISLEYPDIVIANGTGYDILSTLSLPASRPLYLGEGDELSFSEGVGLNLTSPVVFEGSSAEPIILRAIFDGTKWKGINLLEADPEESSFITGIHLSNATIGISTSGSDLRIESSIIENCERSGIEARGPIVQGTSVEINDVNIQNCGYYGIHLQKIGSSIIGSTEIMECVTGIRLYKSSSIVDNLSILDSTSLGFFLFESDASISNSNIGSNTGSSTTAQQQLTLVNSTATITGSTISDGNVCISAIKDSDLFLDGSSVFGGFSDCIQAESSRVHLIETRILDAGESGIHLESSQLIAEGSELISNGAGSGSLRFSSIYMNNSHARWEGGSVMDSAYAHFHLVGSRIRCGNSTLGNSGDTPVLLDDGSTAEYMNIPAPSNARFIDIFSSVVNLITVEVEVLDYITGSPVQSTQVDITNRNGELKGSDTTGPSGRTEPIAVRTFKNTSVGTASELPLKIIALNDSSEVSTYNMPYGKNHVTIMLYPPNDPPELTIISPVNSTEVTDTISIEGYLMDDLGVSKLRFRIDQGEYRTVDLVIDDPASGYFTIDVDPGILQKGEREIWIHAFDGSHLSSPQIRRIIVTGSGLDDTDNDGLPDILEDVNGNGIVDDNETDPNDPDTDADGLIDGIEMDDSDGATTNPLNEDTDGDFILDGTEDSNRNGRVDANETDPNMSDTDGDEVSDLDDLYPLDKTRWEKPDEGNEGSIMTLVFIVVIGILVILLGFALFQRFGGGGGPVRSREEEESGRRPERSKADARRRPVRRAPPRKDRRDRDWK